MLSEECKAVVLTCIDYRFIQPLNDFLSSAGLIGACDLIAWPGGAAALLTRDREHIEEALRLAIEVHGPNLLILVAHEDCYRTGGSESFPSHDDEIVAIDKILRSASTLVRQLFPNIQTRSIRLVKSSLKEV